MCRCCPCEPSAGDVASQPRQKECHCLRSASRHTCSNLSLSTRHGNMTATCNAPAQMLGGNSITKHAPWCIDDARGCDKQLKSRRARHTSTCDRHEWRRSSGPAPLRDKLCAQHQCTASMQIFLHRAPAAPAPRHDNKCGPKRAVDWSALAGSNVGTRLCKAARAGGLKAGIRMTFLSSTKPSIRWLAKRSCILTPSSL